jgi:hypothetical protein
VPSNREFFPAQNFDFNHPFFKKIKPFIPDDRAPKIDSWRRPQAAGRKPKSKFSSTRLSEIELQACAAPLTPAQIERKAQRACDDALTQTERGMLDSSSDPVRIKAATYILDRAFGLPSTSTGVDMTMPRFGQEFRPRQAASPSAAAPWRASPSKP